MKKPMRVFGLTILLVFTCLPRSLASDVPAIQPFVFRDIPLGDPAYRQITDVDDLLYGLGYGPLDQQATFTGKRTMTIYEFGADIARILPAFSSAPLPPHRSAPPVDARQRLEEHPRVMQEFLALVRRFGCIARACGVDPAKMEDLKAYPAAFSGVPEHHWASDSVEALLVLGIMKGYPAGSYSIEDSARKPGNVSESN